MGPLGDVLRLGPASLPLCLSYSLVPLTRPRPAAGAAGGGARVRSGILGAALGSNMSDIDDDADAWSGSFDRSQQELNAMRVLGGLCAQSALTSPEVLATLQLLSPWMLPLLGNAFESDFRTYVRGGVTSLK